MTASSEVRRRKNPQKSSNTSSMAPSSMHSVGEVKKRPRPDSSDADDGNAKTPPTPSFISRLSKNDYDEYAWFIVFLTALSYFIITRGGSSNRGGVLSSFSKPYEVVASSVFMGDGNKENEKLLRSIFYIANSQKQDESSLLTLEPNRRLEVILSSPPDVDSSHDKECIPSSSGQHGNGNQKQQTSTPYLSHLGSTTWVHDEELGRGYLLLADAGRSGRIWRWEVGGGPITIGRSLHMERSGCRSGLWVNNVGDDGSVGNGTCPENLFGESTCANTSLEMGVSTTFQPPLLGSASLAVELTRNAERSSAGKSIIVAEWGERRIVRVEGESGARTPLVTLVPNEGNGDEEGWRRVLRPNHLMYTPFGDLLFSDNFFESDTTNNGTSAPVGAVYRRKEAVHAAPILVEQSRDAHGWKGTTGADHDGDDNIDILFQTSGVIEGMALGSDFSILYVLVTTSTEHSAWTKTVYKVPIAADDNEDESENETDEKLKVEAEVGQLYTMSSVNCKEDGAENDTHIAHAHIGSKLAVDEKGTMYLISCPSSVTLLSQDDGHVVGSLALDNVQTSQVTAFTSVNFGEDGYLYITSPNELMRVKSRVAGMSLPTNMVVPPPLLKPKSQDNDKQRRDKRDKQ